MDDSCALQYYYFQLGERNGIIEKIKNFIRSRKYLKNKPSLSNIYDISLLESLKEFQRYKKLQIIDGSFNDETYAALGSEMSELQISSIRRVDSQGDVIVWLLSGKLGKIPFALGRPARVEQSDGNSANEKADNDLAKLLTQSGLVRAASAKGRESHFRLADGKVFTIHVYGDATGTAVTGLYLPKFFLHPIYEGGDTVSAKSESGEIIGIAHLRVSSQAELNKNYKSGKTNDAGSVYIGEIAGLKGDTSCYRHSHIHFFPSSAARQRIKNIKSGNSGFDEPTVANSKDLLDVRELLRR